MPYEYEINDLAKEDSWRMFRIIGELVEGFDSLSSIGPAITIYGSARIEEGDETYTQAEEIARRLGELGFSIITGGGPGVMEAANKGAREAGVLSIGLNIELPKEQTINPYTTKSITFHHFFIRKVMLAKYATAFVIMPGGLGTLDELTEVLTLIQTYKMKPFPVLLFKSSFWKGLMDWLENDVMSTGYISEEDLHLLRLCDHVDEIVDVVQNWYIKREVTGRKALIR
jgi:uncharacterized protein (TIGR00730 family)